MSLHSLIAVLCVIQLAASSSVLRGTGPNLALRKPTWQSSTYPYQSGGDSSKAVDGNKDPNWFSSYSCTATNGGNPYPWWAVDLGQTYNVGSIQLTNRADCCPERENNLVFGLTNTAPTVSPPSINSVAICGRGPAVATAGQVITVNCAAGLAPARYVVVLSPQEYLTICELEVYGTANPCDLNPCKNGGVCTSRGDSFSCACPAGWTGTDCATANPCYPNPCKNGGVCTSRGTSFLCTCPAGWTGTDCATANPCDLNPCKNGGVCTSRGNFFSCTCPAGWTGTDCTTVQNPCQAGPCKNGGTCSANGAFYTCSCVPGWAGSDCTTDVNVCLKENPCKNGGTCVKFGFGYECKCAANWAGTNCDMGGAKCKAILPQNRINCGWGGVTLAQCNERSCCFDPMKGRPSCFYAVNECETMPVNVRADCGFRGISYAQCLGRGCCFDDDDTNTGPVCYRKVNPECRGVAASRRVARGNANIQPNECAAKGWCWDSSAVPNCFTRGA